MSWHLWVLQSLELLVVGTLRASFCFIQVAVIVHNPLWPGCSCASSFCKGISMPQGKQQGFTGGCRCCLCRVAA